MKVEIVEKIEKCDTTNESVRLSDLSETNPLSKCSKTLTHKYRPVLP